MAKKMDDQAEEYDGETLETFDLESIDGIIEAHDTALLESFSKSCARFVKEKLEEAKAQIADVKREIQGVKREIQGVKREIVALRALERAVRSRASRTELDDALRRVDAVRATDASN